MQLCGRLHTLTGPALGYPSAAVLQNICTYRQGHTLGYHGVALLQVIHTHRNVLFNTVASSAAGNTYTQEPSLRYHGATLVQVINSPTLTMLAIKVAIYFIIIITQLLPTLRYPGSALQ